MDECLMGMPSEPFWALGQAPLVRCGRRYLSLGGQRMELPCKVAFRTGKAATA